MEGKSSASGNNGPPFFPDEPSSKDESFSHLSSRGAIPQTRTPSTHSNRPWIRGNDDLPEDTRATRVVPTVTSCEQERFDVVDTLRSLGAWLERDIYDRQLELRTLLERVDRLVEGLQTDRTGQKDMLKSETAPLIHNQVIERLPVESTGSMQGPLRALHNVTFASHPEEYSPSSDFSKATPTLPYAPNMQSISLPPLPSNPLNGYNDMPPLVESPLGFRPTPPQPQSNSPLGFGPASHPVYPLAFPGLTMGEHLTPIIPDVSNNTPWIPPLPSPLQELPSAYDKNETQELRATHLPFPASIQPPSTSFVSPYLSRVLNFTVSTILRQFYLYLLLKLPSLYKKRVSRVSEDAELSMPHFRQAIAGYLSAGKSLDAAATPMNVPALITFRRTWESFIDSLMREWKTFNIVSVLLLSAILTILQIQGAVGDPVTRTAALLSLISALMSLLFGCIFIVRFSTMRRMYKAASWTREAQKSKTSIFWNVWVLLAIPAIWLSWSLLLFLTSILSFVWRTGSSLDNPAPLSSRFILGSRITITGVFVLGLLHFIMIIKTFKRYESAMDEEWSKSVLDPNAALFPPSFAKTSDKFPWRASSNDAPGRINTPNQAAHIIVPQAFTRGVNKAVSFSPFPAIKIEDMDDLSSAAKAPSLVLVNHDINTAEWERFITFHAVNADGSPVHPWKIIHDIMNTWNRAFFHQRLVKVVLGNEHHNPVISESDSEPVDLASLAKLSSSTASLSSMPSSGRSTQKETCSLYLVCIKQGFPIASTALQLESN